MTVKMRVSVRVVTTRRATGSPNSATLKQLGILDLKCDGDSKIGDYVNVRI